MTCRQCHELGPQAAEIKHSWLLQLEVNQSPVDKRIQYTRVWTCLDRIHENLFLLSYIEIWAIILDLFGGGIRKILSLVPRMRCNRVSASARSFSATITACQISAKHLGLKRWSLYRLDGPCSSTIIHLLKVLDPLCLRPADAIIGDMGIPRSERCCSQRKAS